MGITHNITFKYIEHLWELPLKWFWKFICFESQKEDFSRRLEKLPKDADEKKIYEAQDRILKEYKSARMEMYTFAFLGFALELGQRILDIPYFSGPSAFFDDCNGLSEARLVTKPTIFYFIFVVVEVLGLFMYWVGMTYLAKNISDKMYHRSESIIIIFASFVEVPVMMILEYFFHERFLSSDSFAENTLVLMNNILTFIFVLSLASLAVDFVYSNIRPTPFGSYEENSGTANGELTIEELMTFISCMLLVLASVIRLVVNTNGTAELKFDYLKVGDKYDHMDSNKICKNSKLTILKSLLGMIGCSLFQQFFRFCISCTLLSTNFSISVFWT